MGFPDFGADEFFKRSQHRWLKHHVVIAAFSWRSQRDVESIEADIESIA